ncbi:hypothetical protein LINGRAHAP2_LOCUS25725 [Linum grandiflorum]
MSSAAAAVAAHFPDFQFSAGILELDELFETLNIEEKQSSGKKQYDTRRSLAWDSAFFNSAGVLDAEELSMVNRAFRSSDAKPVNGVESDVWRSVESNCTGNSDGSSSLASLEVDLFSDIRGPFYQKRKETVVQEGNGGSSSGRPPRMSIRGVSGSSTTESRRAPRMSSQGKTRTMKSTPKSKSPSSVLPANGNGFATETPPSHSRRAVATPTSSSVPSFRTPLKFLAGLRNSSSSSSSSLRSSSFSSKPKVSPVSSISQLLLHNSSSESKVPRSRFGSSTAPQATKKSSPTPSPAAAATTKASGLKMPSPKLGYFDPDNPSGSLRRSGTLKSKPYGQPRISDVAAGRTSLGKHQLSGNHLSFSLNSIKTGKNNEQWEDCFSNNNVKKKKKRSENCSCNKRPENNKENSIAVATSSSISSSFDGHLKPVRFSPIWK